ncbi:MAG: ATP-dependent DNA helicase RecG [Ardenticatenales bacterium]
MTAHPDPLTRILALELANGCRDDVVIGGLSAFLLHWRATAATTVPAAAVDAIARALGEYAALSPADRKRRIAAAQLALRPSSAAGPAAAPVADAAPSTPTHPRRATTQPRQATPTPSAAPTRPPIGAGPPERGVDQGALDASVTTLSGVGAKLRADLERLGLRTVRDVLFHAPLRYRDFSRQVPIARVRPGDEVTIGARVVEVRRAPGKAVRSVLTIVVADDTGRLALTFFNQPYLANELRVGRAIVASGRAEVVGGRIGLASPEWEPAASAGTHTGRVVPIYPLVAGLGQRTLRRIIAAAVAQHADAVGDPVPSAVRAAEGLLGRAEAVRALHLGASLAEVERGRARLAFDELLALQLWARRRRLARAAVLAPDLSAGRPLQRAFIAQLPFTLTDAQERVVAEIEADLCAASPMSRLLQGDVGSGKTAVAGAAAVLCAGAGFQAAIMAPTELLADQHLRSLAPRLEAIGFERFEPDLARAITHDPAPDATPEHVDGRTLRYARLVGGMKPSEKAAVAEALGRGAIDIVFGTHALIQDRVAFARLGLAVIDEQHRFGVLQRSTLAGAADGPTPHTLIMTATPIPRTLAHVLNADLEQSVIDRLPPGRQPIRTLWLKPDERARAYAFVRQRIGQGEQAFIVCPLVEESERIDSPAATTLHERLQGSVFPDLHVGLLHGRMRPSEKEAVMADFQRGAIQILVATTVIEVGIDVPNATVMLIDGADRFGLAQLHQLRGRVGRGRAESFCLLLADDPSRTAAERLQAVAATSDGLALAERDLALRGPGDYFGTVQAGVIDRFRFARIVGDPGPLASAARVAAAVLARDPALALAEHEALRAAADAFAAGAERA